MRDARHVRFGVRLGTSQICSGGEVMHDGQRQKVTKRDGDEYVGWVTWYGAKGRVHTQSDDCMKHAAQHNGYLTASRYHNAA